MKNSRIFLHTHQCRFIWMKESFRSGKLLQAIRADKLAHKGTDISCIIAENARRMILLEDDSIIFNKDFQGVTNRDVKCSAQLNRQNDASEFVKLANYASRFHGKTPP